MRISAVIPAYNAAAFIERAIRSVLAQTRAADEIIVVDDGSKDNTAEIIRRFGDKAQLIQQPNSGASAARNAGVRAAGGDWIAFLDADDEWLPEYLKMQTGLLSRNPHLVWSMTNFFTCSCMENRKAPFVQPKKVELFLQGKEFLDDYLAAWAQDIQGHLDTTLIRKDILVNEICFNESLHCAEDLDLWWQMAYRYPAAGFISSPLAVYHFAAPESLTRQKTDVSFFVHFIKQHLELSGWYHRQALFELIAQKMLRLWIRGMLFDARGEDIRRLLKEFPNLYPVWYRIWMTLLTTFPNVTASVCRGISRVVRMFHLRRRVVAPPRDTNES